MHPPPVTSVKINRNPIEYAGVALTTFEGDIRIETLKSGRAQIHATYALSTATSGQRILVGEDSLAACLEVRGQALIGSGRTASLRHNVSIRA